MAIPVYVYSTFAFIGFLLSCIPLPWHWQARNASTCLFMAWTALGCLNMFINSIIWAKDAINYAPVWCDISARIILGINIGVPAASLCINRRLYHIAACKTVTLDLTPAQRRRELLIELAIGIGLPVLQMILVYTVQGHRFDIFEEIGCWPVEYDSYLLIPLVTAWPVIIGLITLSYCVRSIYYLYHRNTKVRELLSSSTEINSHRYIRLMCLAGIEALCTTPLSIFILVVEAQHTRPMASWAVVHYRFSVIRQFPSILWRLNHTTVFALEFSRWSCVACAFIFFMFFGFADEALKHYRLAYTTVTKRLGYSTGATSTAITASTTDMRAKNFPHLAGSLVMPTVHRKIATKHDSISSFDLTIVDVSGLLDEPTKTTTMSSGLMSSRASTYSQSSPTDVDAPEIVRPQPTLDIMNVPRRSGEPSPVRPPRPESLGLAGTDAA